MRGRENGSIGFGAGLIAGGALAAAAWLAFEAKELRKKAKYFTDQLEEKSHTELKRTSNQVKGRVDLVVRDVGNLHTEVGRLRTDVDRAFQSHRGRAASKWLYIAAAVLLVLILVMDFLAREVGEPVHGRLLGVSSLAAGALIAIVVLLMGTERGKKD